ncbi:MAG: hypothetical protein EZS28_049259, partial [Streblomastix strix]
MNNTFSKTDTQQKMTYAQIANSQEEQLRFYLEHGPKAWLIASSKLGWPVALLSLPSAPPLSTASIFDDSDQDFHAQQEMKRKRTERTLSESSSSTSSSRSSRHRRTHSKRHKRKRHNDEFRKEMAKIIGVHRPSYFDPNMMELRDFLEEVRTEIQPNEAFRAYADCTIAASLAESALIAEIHHINLDQPPSRYLIDAYLMCLTVGACLRQNNFAHPTQGQSKNQASGCYRSAPAQGTSTHDNASYYGRRNKCTERGHRQPNDNQRAQNRQQR